jgi:phosphatidylserine/phosphatidylglycerophosphate/cardiolipin synthase-like enzyme
MLSQMLADYAIANDEGKQDMFEEAAERMITAEKGLKYASERLQQRQDAPAARIAQLEAALKAIHRNLTVARNSTSSKAIDRLLWDAAELANTVLANSPDS